MTTPVIVNILPDLLELL